MGKNKDMDILLFVLVGFLIIVILGCASYIDHKHQKELKSLEIEKLKLEIQKLKLENNEKTIR